MFVIVKLFRCVCVGKEGGRGGRTKNIFISPKWRGICGFDEQRGGADLN